MAKGSKALAHQVAYTEDTLAREHAYAFADKYFASASVPEEVGTLSLDELESITMDMEYATAIRPDASLLNMNEDTYDGEAQYLLPANFMADAAPRRGMSSHGGKYGVLLGRAGMMQVLADERFQSQRVLAKDYDPYAVDLGRPNEVLY